MTRIKSALSAKGADAQANAAEWRKLTHELIARRRAAAEGGSSKARERHIARSKLLARERIACTQAHAHPVGLELGLRRVGEVLCVGDSHEMPR